MADPVYICDIKKIDVMLKVLMLFVFVILSNLHISILLVQNHKVVFFFLISSFNVNIYHDFYHLIKEYLYFFKFNFILEV